MRRLLLGLGFPLLAMGCAGSFEEARHAHIAVGVSMLPRDAVRCQVLDDRQSIETAMAELTAGTATALGGATAIPGESSGVRIGLGIGAGVVAAGTATLVKLANGDAQSWAKECAQ